MLIPGLLNLCLFHYQTGPGVQPGGQHPEALQGEGEMPWNTGLPLWLGVSTQTCLLGAYLWHRALPVLCGEERDRRKGTKDNLGRDSDLSLGGPIRQGQLKTIFDALSISVGAWDGQI